MKSRKVFAGAHEAGAVVVVVFEAVAGDVFAPNDASTIVHVAREGKAGNAVAFRANRLPRPHEGEDQVVEPLVVDQIDDRAGAADDQNRIVFLDPACGFLKRPNYSAREAARTATMRNRAARETTPRD